MATEVSYWIEEMKSGKFKRLNGEVVRKINEVKNKKKVRWKIYFGSFLIEVVLIKIEIRIGKIKNRAVILEEMASPEIMADKKIVFVFWFFRYIWARYIWAKKQQINSDSVVPKWESWIRPGKNVKKIVNRKVWRRFKNWIPIK